MKKWENITLNWSRVMRKLAWSKLLFLNWRQHPMNFFKTVMLYRRSIIYLLIFLWLVYLSPFKDVIYSKDFIQSFWINLFLKGTPETSDLNAPFLTYPLTESSACVKGKGSSPGSLVTIYINNKPSFTIQADKEGNFECEIGRQLKVGDAVSVQQNKFKSSSPISVPVLVSDGDYKLARFKMDEEKEKIGLIESSCTLLISWSVLIIGALSYMILYRRGAIRFLWIALFIIFLMVMSIYYGVSTKSPIISAIDKHTAVLSTSNIHLYWWKQIEFFERGLFLACVLMVLNLGISAPQIKEDAH